MSDGAQPLGHAGWLANDEVIGGWVHFAGFVLCAAAIVIGWRALAALPAAIIPSSSPGSPA